MATGLAALRRCGGGLLLRSAAAAVSPCSAGTTAAPPALLPLLPQGAGKPGPVAAACWAVAGARNFSAGMVARDAAAQETAAAVPEAATTGDWADLPLPQFIYHTAKEKREPVTLNEAVAFVKAEAEKRKRKFTETVDLAINLGTNPKRGDQSVRSSVSLPHGTGSTVRVGVFVPPEEVEAALAAGADVAGADDLIQHVQETGGGSKMSFDKVLATPDMMKALSRVARILGPRGLMPNPKLGTIVQPSALAEAIAEMKRGRVEFRADKGSVVHVPIGKVNFSSKQLAENAGALVDALLAARPAKLKGSGASGYLLRVHLSSTMGPSVPVLVKSMVAARANKL
eukprot:jgi/Tetstr1/432001/TSEL_021477.t1